jgi:hypothetical protein
MQLLRTSVVAADGNRHTLLAGIRGSDESSELHWITEYVAIHTVFKKRRERMPTTEARRCTATQLASSGEIPYTYVVFEQTRDIDAGIISRFCYVGL